MDAGLDRLVRQRAGSRCEYCGLRQADAPVAVFHVEHIVPRKHGGATVEANLALACIHCNLHKGPNLTGIDPVSGEIARLFDPRREAWTEHFKREGPLIIGTTPVGRATVRVMAMNEPSHVALRAEV